MSVKVSVVIPVYNSANHLRECLDSVLNQTMPSIEFLCIDDGSTDSSAQILDDYAASDSRIKVIHNENKGYGCAMNAAMTVACGEYLGFLKTDDIIHPRMYERLYNIAKEHDLDLVKANFSRFEINAGVLKDMPAKIAYQSSSYNRVIYAEEDQHIAILGSAVFIYSGIYKSSFLRNNGIQYYEAFDTYKDHEFWFMTMICAQKFFFHNESFYMSRIDISNPSMNNMNELYCIQDEYDFILCFLRKSPELYKKAIYVYWWARYCAYRNLYRNVPDEFKATFVKNFQAKMKTAFANREIKQDLFSQKNWDDLNLLMSDPLAFDTRERRKQQRSVPNPNLKLRIKWYYEDHGIIGTIKHAMRSVSPRIRALLQHQRNSS